MAHIVNIQYQVRFGPKDINTRNGRAFIPHRQYSEEQAKNDAIEFAQFQAKCGFFVTLFEINVQEETFTEIKF